MLKWAGHVTHIAERRGEERCIQRGLMAKSEGKRQLGTPTHRLVENIKEHPRSGMENWTGFIWIRMGGDGRFCERGSGLSCLQNAVNLFSS
jgi:hypothetical protein